jgi:hypothetical protein
LSSRAFDEQIGLRKHKRLDFVAKRGPFELHDGSSGVQIELHSVSDTLDDRSARVGDVSHVFSNKILRIEMRANPIVRAFVAEHHDVHYHTGAHFSIQILGEFLQILSHFSTNEIFNCRVAKVNTKI